jgi:hypothetical protein
MTESDYATRQLKVIRSLMERATIYRSLSAPTALVGGLLSFGGFATAYYAETQRQHPLSPTEFLIVWLVILALTSFANLIFLWRGCAQRAEPFFSPGMKTALLSVAPIFISAGILSFMLHHPIQLALLWIGFYGLGLLATQHFAPRSLIVLGVAFFLTGCVLLVSWKHLFLPSGHGEPSALVVSGIMAGTFGGYHLVYAVAVWAFGEDRIESASPETENV